MQKRFFSSINVHICLVKNILIKTQGQTGIYTLLKLDFKGAGIVAAGSKLSVKFASLLS